MPHQAKLGLHPKTIVEFLNDEEVRAFARSKCVARIYVDGSRLTVHGVAVPFKVTSAK